MFKMSIIISYAPRVINTIEKYIFKLIIVAFNETVYLPVSNRHFYQFLNQILDKYRCWKDTTSRKRINTIHEDFLLSFSKQFLGFKLGV